VLWGSAGHAKVLADVIALRGGRVLALFDNRDVPSALPGVPIFLGEVGFEQWVRNGAHSQHIAGLAAIGGNRGRDRLFIQELFKKYEINLPVLVHPAAVVSRSVHLGEGTQILALANVAADVATGDACIINHNASVDHECVIGNGVHIGPGATLCGCVTVGENAFIGAGAVILPRVTIGANAIVGAGAVVTRDVQHGSTVIGNPATAIKSR
jgi:sugar O-acyltransferase (sialic acid O-acetyltransferase NeuD family)